MVFILIKTNIYLNIHVKQNHKQKRDLFFSLATFASLYISTVPKYEFFIKGNMPRMYFFPGMIHAGIQTCKALKYSNLRIKYDAPYFRYKKKVEKSQILFQLILNGLKIKIVEEMFVRRPKLTKSNQMFETI